MGEVWWRARAECRDAPLPMVDEAFRRPGGPAAQRFKARYCQQCPVAAACLGEAMSSTRHEFGVWGSTSPKWRTEHGAPPSTRLVGRREAAA